MSNTNLNEALRLAAHRLVEARFTLALTGAGISTPSGIPDFRATGGLWSRYPIREYGTIAAFCSDPDRVWRMYREVFAQVTSARPNPAHLALAELEALGRLHALVTQNVDGLHQAAGSRAVSELHGTYRALRCLACDQTYREQRAMSLFEAALVPRCPCGAVLKPDVVLFGEGLPPKVLRDAFVAARQADVILVVGTSMQVAPASELPSIVSLSGGTVIEFNLADTDLSDLADIRIVGDVAHTLPALAAEVRRVLGEAG